MFTHLSVFSFIIGLIFGYQWTSPLNLLIVVWLIITPYRRLLVPFSLGACAVWLAASYHQKKLLSPELWQVPQEIQVEILSAQVWEYYLYHYQVFSKELNQSFRLSHYQREQALEPGHCYQLTVKLKPRHALGNPTTAGYARQFWVDREFVQGHIEKKQPITEIPCSSHFLSLVPLKTKINHNLEELELSTTALALIKALVIGDRGAMNAFHREVLQKTGTAHLMAISGLHIGLVYVLCNFIFALLLRPLACVMLCANILLVARIFALVAAGGYVLISGAGVSSLRAWGMLALVTVLTLRRSHYPGLSILLIVIAVILLLDPLAGMGLGLWLSAVSVFALIWLGARGWQVHWKLALLLFPLTAVTLNSSLISPLANLLAVPLVSFLVVPGALIGVMMQTLHIPGADHLIQAVAWLIDTLWIGLEWVSQYSQLVHWSLLDWTSWVLVFTLMICLLLPWRLVGAIPIVILMASLTWAKPLVPEPGTILLRVIDAGQGTALLVQVGEKNLLFDVGNTVVSDYLLHERIKHLDVLVVSHRDKDHRAGLADLLSTLTVDKFYAGEHLSESTSTQPCLAGEGWSWEEVRFEFLAPLHEGLKGNNASCVLKISLGEQSILMTGDIERKVEKELLLLKPQLLRSTILIAPHHGSKTSSSVDFIQAVSPQIVIYPTGFLNAYHHPHPAIVERYSEFGVKQYNTAQDGALSVKLSKRGVESLRCYRQDHPHWWNMNEEATCLGYFPQGAR